MLWWNRLIMQVKMLLGREVAGYELDRELQYHLDRQIAENLAAGMSADDARRSALRAFGNPALLRDQARATWNWSWLELLLRDLRLGLRTLRRASGFTVIAVLVIGLGIGANVALFTVVRGVLLKPLPYPHSNQLVTLYESDTGRPHFNPVAAGSFFEWQRDAHGVQQMAMVSPFQDYNVSAESGRLPEHVDAAWCSWNFFNVLGVPTALGRTFRATDDEAGSAATAILTASFWHRRYGSDPMIVGKTVWLNAKPYTIVGVLPESFHFSGAFVASHVQIWTPIGHEAPPELLSTFSDHEVIGVARLQPGTSLTALVNQLQTVQRQVKKDHPGPAVHDSVSARSLLDDAVGEARTPLYALLTATFCVLLIACLNVAGLLVARTAARGKEMAVRAALGGGRWRLLRERVIESLLLSMGGGGLGVLLAWAALRALVHFRPDMNRVEAIHMDGVVALFTVFAISLCALFSGLISAFSSEGKEALSALHDSSRSSRGSRKRATLRKSLLVVEVCLTVVLLAGAGLLIKSYQRMRTAGLGIPTDNVLTLHLSLPEARYKTPEQRVGFFEDLITRVRSIPGVQAAGLVNSAPGQGWGGDRITNVVEHPPLPDHQGYDLQIRTADPGYFAAAEIPLLRGRVFSPQERLDRANVLVISKSAAQQLFPGEDPIGKHLALDKASLEIIGVVGDTRWSLAEPPHPMMYVPIYGDTYAIATILVRSQKNVDALALPIQGVISQLDRDLPVSDVMTLDETIGKSTLDSQFDSLLVLAFALIALVLAATGLYGVLAYLVAQRTGEIGIRMALGAPRVQVLRLVLVDGMRPAVIGLVLGLICSVATGRLITSILYNTSPLDAANLAQTAVMLLLVAVVACLLPAWRASHLDPVQALRTE